MTRRLRDVLLALRLFVRGFAGLPGPHSICERNDDPASARRALAERSARRGTCC